MKTDIVYQEDCIEGMKKIPSNSIDLVLTDPPYGITACEWDKPIDLKNFWVEIKRVLKENGCVIVTASQPFTTDLINSNREMFKYCLIWVKSRRVGFSIANKQPMRMYENILVFYDKQPIYNPQLEEKPKEDIRFRKKQPKSKKGVYGIAQDGVKDVFEKRTIPIDKNYPSNVLFFKSNCNSKTFHPTQKPVELFKYLIKTYSNENQLVLDCFAGSGTTAIACIETNRKYICFENNPQYFKIINNRIKSAKSQTQLSNESCPTEDLI